MKRLINELYRDENGFIVSAELVIVMTIAVLSMVVGLSEVSHNINQELEDVGSAFGSVHQTYCYNGAKSHHAKWKGSRYFDDPDFCDGDCDLQRTRPTSEGKYGH